MSTLAVAEIPVQLSKLDLTPAARIAITDACLLAEEVTQVQNAREQETAASAQRNLVGLINGIEAARKKLKQPVLDLLGSPGVFVRGCHVEHQRQVARTRGSGPQRSRPDL